ncbi:hypothetical protein N7510_000469 [Penicillium lagena]|uniref:uncharacterized protein n=1 Tax=Penicillium lagena TaxID=94218 RepID=UPI0025406E1D|nr:uncharacterized protein N7510_000469 [Penicillium lagena]KAJ5624160.1 hypothetical protein N7510_000469 [Penicillium lagena]
METVEKAPDSPPIMDEKPKSAIRILLSKARVQIPEGEVGPPPDGGFQAWCQIVAGHFTVCNTWGYITAFGMFQTYYEGFLNESASNISWIGSIQVFLLFFIGTFSGRAVDAGFFKLTWGTGAILNILGIFMASISKTYWQLLLSQGVCMGLGFGLMFSPPLSLLPTYFTTRRSLGVGLAAAGSATGGLIFPAVVQRLLPTVGYAWTMRVLGFLTLTMLVPSFFLFQQRVPPRRSGPIIEWAAFREKAYVFFSVGMYLNYWGLYIAFFYITSFARQIIGLNEKEAIDLLLILNGVGILARTIPNFIADRRTGPLNLLILSTLMSSVMLFCWIAVSDTSGLYAFVVFYGIFSAGTQSLFPATLASITDDMKKIGIKLGMVMTILSFATLTGNPIAGALLTKDHGGFFYAQLFAAATMMVGTVWITIARFCRTGLVLRAKI